MDDTDKSTTKATQQFDTSRYVRDEYKDIVTIWMLKAMLKLDCHRKFINTKDCSFSHNEIANFLGLGHFIDVGKKRFKKELIMEAMSSKYKQLTNDKPIHKKTTLDKNTDKMSEMLGLEIQEATILKFVVLLLSVTILDQTLSLAREVFKSQQTMQVISVLLDIPWRRTKELLSHGSKLHKTSLVEMQSYAYDDFGDAITTVNEKFLENMCEQDGDILNTIESIVSQTSEPELILRDYSHMVADIDVLVNYMQHATDNRTTGANVLLYGLPGTGKTQLAKTVAKVVEKNLFEVNCIDTQGDAMRDQDRISAYKLAQGLLSSKSSILLYDEAEDMFDSYQGSLFSPQKKQDNKAWINKMLETNSLPTIWITNDINSIDNAIIRRFDINIEVKIPQKSHRIKMLKKYSKEKLDDETIKQFATHKHIAPSLISSTAKVVDSIKPKFVAKTFKHILNNTLQAQGYKKIKETTKDDLPQTYSTKLINTTADISSITKGIKTHHNARLCLYGVPGTGKSAYGRYIAQYIEKPVILKKPSDLQSKWLGECEKNIARAFEEAADEKAVLIFDEVDSFLGDRSTARQRWEISQANEMLVQMENFDGVFVATTNLLSNLDKASMRRFDLKLEFRYLEPYQSWQLFCLFAKQFGIDKPTKATQHIIKSMTQLTPGDFTAVQRQSRFRPIKDTKNLCDRLVDEIRHKEQDSEKIGFV
ncbi:MAG: AAA family ATPase [Epsilonproteobacteria bacterium]|nr:MAG: AAA family ATPase [Campylobacterota bacterium]